MTMMFDHQSAKVCPTMRPNRNNAAGNLWSNLINCFNNLNFTFIYSTILAISCLAGCSAQKIEPKIVGNPILERGQILNRYQVVTDYRRSDYLAKISQKLSSAAGLDAPIDISILKTDLPLAFSISNGDVFISTGFIHQLHDEESFVFILAHELSHALLEHHQAQQPEASFELAADSLALNIILRAGYPAQSVFPTLVNSYSSGFISRHDSISSAFGSDKLVHPPLQERIINLNDTFSRFELSATDIQEIAFGNNSDEYFDFSTKLQS